MSRQLTIRLDLPNDWKRFQMPRALRSRLQELLDRQDQAGKISAAERREASALVELSEMMALLKLRTKNAGRHGK